MYIKSIKIKNFRKIIDQQVNLSDFNVFVGLNDSGKSTILKALNLFFNNETEKGHKFNFNEDFSKNAKIIRKKAPEIVIELQIKAPQTYNPAGLIIWRKKWRRDGLQEVDDITYVDGTKIPTKKKIRSWVKKIRYRYVPAVKSQSFFSDLLGDLHDTLAIAIEKDLKSASDKFSSEIKKSTEGISLEIKEKIKLLSVLDLPSDLRNIFRSLEFITGDTKISLEQRGDGIKTRHIPIILKFIAEQENIQKVKGSPIVSTIWGYEEPENSLEMLAALDLARNFYDYAQKTQILITTHSPAFYSLEVLKEIEPKTGTSKPIKTQFIKQDSERGIKLLEKDATLIDIDEEVGILPLLESKMKAVIEERNKVKKELQSINNNSIILEGKGDKLIIEKSIELFSSKLKKLLDEEELIISYSTSGANGVADKLIAAAHGSEYNCFGLFDNDSAGFQNRDRVLKIERCKDNNGKKIKVMLFKLNQQLGEIKNKLPTFEFELEDFYSAIVWTRAEEWGYLEKRNQQIPGNFPHDKTIQQYFEDNFGDQHQRRIGLNKIKDTNKEVIARWVVSQENCRDLLINFKPLIEEIEVFFIRGQIPI